MISLLCQLWAIWETLVCFLNQDYPLNLIYILQFQTFKTTSRYLRVITKQNIQQMETLQEQGLEPTTNCCLSRFSHYIPVVMPASGETDGSNISAQPCLPKTFQQADKIRFEKRGDVDRHDVRACLCIYLLICLICSKTRIKASKSAVYLLTHQARPHTSASQLI